MKIEHEDKFGNKFRITEHGLVIDLPDNKTRRIFSFEHGAAVKRVNEHNFMKTKFIGFSLFGVHILKQELGIDRIVVSTSKGHIIVMIKDIIEREGIYKKFKNFELQKFFKLKELEDFEKLRNQETLFTG